jgi:hypothetical protein
MRILSSRAAVFRRAACMAFVPALCLCLSACSFPPDAQELRGHLAATVQTGWSGLSVESVEILERVEAGKDWKVDASYRVRLTSDKNALPREEQERIARYLPQCDPMLNHKGDHCAMRESVVFTRSDYGWMPKELAVGRPDLLPRIAEEGRRRRNALAPTTPTPASQK